MDDELKAALEANGITGVSLGVVHVVDSWCDRCLLTVPFFFARIIKADQPTQRIAVYCSRGEHLKLPEAGAA